MTPITLNRRFPMSNLLTSRMETLVTAGTGGRTAKTHRATQGKHFSCSLEAFRRALSTHARAEWSAGQNAEGERRGSGVPILRGWAMNQPADWHCRQTDLSVRRMVTAGWCLTATAAYIAGCFLREAAIEAAKKYANKMEAVNQ